MILNQLYSKTLILSAFLLFPIITGTLLPTNRACAQTFDECVQSLRAKYGLSADEAFRQCQLRQQQQRQQQPQERKECKESGSGFDTACGYGCAATDFEVRCAQTPGNHCVANDFSITCTDD